MGLLENIRLLRLRLHRTWAAWNAPMPRLYRANSLDDDKKAILRHALTGSVERTDTDLKEALLEDLEEEVGEHAIALDEANRGGNGNGDD